MSLDCEEDLETCMFGILEEYKRARTLHKPMQSPHEGLAILREEYLELERLVFWPEKNKDTPEGIPYNNSRMYEEARKIAAMALAFMHECT